MKSPLVRLLIAAIVAAVWNSSIARAADQMPSPTTKVITSLGDVPLALTTIGDTNKQPILFVHGLMSASAVWTKQLTSELSEDYHLAAVDVRGHGSSGKPFEKFHYVDTRFIAADIAAAMDSLGDEQIVLVAHSYGGLFVMDYVRHYGTDRIAGIVFVGSNGGIAEPKPKQPDTPEKLARIERSRSPNIYVNTQWTTEFVNQYLLGSTDTDTPDAEMLRVAAMMVPHYVRRYMREHNDNNLDIASALDVPVVFLAGEGHKGANAKVLAYAKSSVPNGAVRTIKGQAHMAHWRGAEVFNAALAQVLEGISKSSKSR